MQTQRHEIEAWPGPAMDQLTTDQVDRVQAAADQIAERHPHEDDADLREAALSATVQFLLGETSVEEAGSRLAAIRAAQREAYAVAMQVAAMAVEAGTPEAIVARQLGVDRMTVRKALGKR